MRETRERPVCHRAEDLVSYLYGEASASDAFDFRNHLQKCEACRSEFAAFNQVHDSMQVWRSEALGASLAPGAIAEPAIEAAPVVRQGRKLSALAALREFFTVAPLWLRGATAFAALLLFVLGVLMVARVPRKPVEVATNNGEKIYSRTYTREELQEEVKKAVDQTRAEFLAKQNSSPIGRPQEDRHQPAKPQVAVNQPKALRPRGLNRQERAQLAADLRLTLPSDENELLLSLPEQENPNR
jgi:hypothetical protein